MTSSRTETQSSPDYFAKVWADLPSHPSCVPCPPPPTTKTSPFPRPFACSPVQSSPSPHLSSLLRCGCRCCGWRHARLKFAKACKTIKKVSQQNRVVDDKTLMRHYKLRILDLKQQVKLLEEKERQARDETTRQEAVLSAQQAVIEANERCEKLTQVVHRMKHFIAASSTSGRCKITARAEEGVCKC